MALLETYLTFNGNCAEAMRFYERTLKGKMEMMLTFAEAPDADQYPPGVGKQIMHASLVIDGHRLMASDSMPGQPHAGMHGFSLSLGYDTAAEAKKTFDALSAGGQVSMPMQETFWAETFGMLVDRFGTPWMLSGGPKPFGEK
jgi:PhnB protein